MAKSKTLRGIVSVVVVCVLLAISAIMLAGCGGTTIKYGFDSFDKDTFAGNVNLTETDNGRIVFNKESTDEIDGSGATYFGEEDKNLDWDGRTTTFAYDLDLSVMENGDFTIWVLAFNKLDNEVYTHIDEIRLGIAKTETGYVASELIGVTWSNEDYNNIIANGETFTSESDNVHIEFKVTYEDDVISYTFVADDVEISNQKTDEGVVGFRSLWNAGTSVDGIVLSNLTQSY